MSTRAAYTFIDNDDKFHVYKHHDGYPSGAIKWIEKAIPYAFEFPRFEASDFSASFIAANKEAKGGGIRCSHSYIDHGDLEYRYEICFIEPNIIIAAYKIENAYEPHLVYKDEKLIFSGTLDEFKVFTNEEHKE